MKLTEKQKRFADHYIETGNATESAVKAGYSKKTADRIASENLRKLELKKYIDELMQKLESERIASAEEVLQNLTAMMRGEIQEDVVIVEGEGDGVSSARVMKKQVSAKERIKAAELLGKRYRLYTDKVEVEGVIPVMIVGESELEE